MAKESSIYCGDYVVPWVNFSIAIDTIAPALGMVYDTLGNQKMAYIEGNDDLACVLARNISCNVTDARDRVYSVLGLVSRAKRYGMEPDYSLDVEEVLIQATYRCIKWRGNLDILSVVATDTNTDTDRPSWVLGSAFSWQDHTMPFEAFVWRAQLLSRTIGPSFCCSATSVSDCRLDTLNHGLKLVGYKFAGVHRVSVEYSPSQVRAVRFGLFFDLLQGMHPWLDWRRLADVDGNRIDPWTHEPMLSVFWQTISGGVLYENYFESKRLFHSFENTYLAMRHIPSCLWSCQILMAIVLAYCFVVARLRMAFGRKDVALYFEQTATTVNRRSFVTVNGAYGMGPKAMQASDYVFILKGGKVPMILRPSNTEGWWTLVGEGYVHGIMHREAYQEELCIPVTIV